MGTELGVNPKHCSVWMPNLNSKIVPAPSAPRASCVLLVTPLSQSSPLLLTRQSWPGHCMIVSLRECHQLSDLLRLVLSTRPHALEIWPRSNLARAASVSSCHQFKLITMGLRPWSNSPHLQPTQVSAGPAYGLSGTVGCGPNLSLSKKKR